MVKWRNSLGQQWFFYVLFCVSLALSWYFHKDATRFSDRSELWSDRAGYYIYLPATFFYRFDTHKMPADLDIRTGGGFSTDTLKNKLDTKYTYGVALLASPFFFASELVSRIAGLNSESGFSMLYMRMMSLAAIVYLLLGLWFLKRFLDHYFRPAVSFFVVTMIFLGTNLFYYSLIDGMMSHVYSFFLFALFLFALKRYHASPTYKYFLLISVILSLAILVRPTSIVLGLLFFTWDAAGPAEWLKRTRQFLKPSRLLAFLAILFLIFLPQMIYWKYLSGKWLYFSYSNEGFTNLGHPAVAEVLFSPVNGLLTYTPLVLFFLAGIAMMIFQRRLNGWLIASVFLLITLVFASWKMWYFGCSYGQRSFIEYYAIIAVPFGWLATWVFGHRLFLVKTIMLFLLFLLAYSNIRYTVALYRFERCYYGSTWDWDHFRRSFERSGVVSPLHRMGSYKNDFENLALSPVKKPSAIFTHSGQYSIAANEKGGITPLYSINTDLFGYPYPKTIEVAVWMLKNSGKPTGASLGYSVAKGNKTLFGDEQPLDKVEGSQGTWFEVRKTFIIPDVNDSSLQIDLFIRNPRQASLYMDDLQLSYRYGWH